MERGDLANPDQGQRLPGLLDQQLGKENIEYRSKRDSLRLGPVRLELLPPGTWARWDRQRLARTGGSLEQYKHPCLLNDANLRCSTLPLGAEVGV